MVTRMMLAVALLLWGAGCMTVHKEVRAPRVPIVDTWMAEHKKVAREHCEREGTDCPPEDEPGVRMLPTAFVPKGVAPARPDAPPGWRPPERPRPRPAPRQRTAPEPSPSLSRAPSQGPSRKLQAITVNGQRVFTDVPVFMEIPMPGGYMVCKAPSGSCTSVKGAAPTLPGVWQCDHELHDCANDPVWGAGPLGLQASTVPAAVPHEPPPVAPQSTPEIASDVPMSDEECRAKEAAKKARGEDYNGCPLRTFGQACYTDPIWECHVVE